MELFLQQIVGGIATGCIYGSVALALVLVFNTGLANFAQGEMAMFTTFVAWTLIVVVGLNYWVAFVITLIAAFVGAVVLERTALRPIEHSPPLTGILVTMGLMLVINALGGLIWGYTVRPFPSPFPNVAVWVGGVSIGLPSLGMLGVSVIMLGLIFLFFNRTKAGLAFRACSQQATTARLMGIKVGWMFAIGWGLASVVGAAGAMQVAPITFLDPSLMAGPLLYGFVGATLGGWNSPLGAVVGGIILGVVQALAGTYIEFFGPEMSFSIALVVILAVLLLKPEGLFGRRDVRRV